jgi:hypothetical protein
VPARVTPDAPRGPAWRGIHSALPLRVNDAMTATLAYIVAVLAVAVVMVEVVARPAFTCPACGARRADGHSPECRWKRNT